MFDLNFHGSQAWERVHPESMKMQRGSFQFAPLSVRMTQLRACRSLFSQQIVWGIKKICGVVGLAPLRPLSTFRGLSRSIRRLAFFLRRLQLAHDGFVFEFVEGAG